MNHHIVFNRVSKTKYWVLALILVTMTILNSCTTTKVDFTIAAVPEEGSFRFVQYTTEDDKVYGPSISRTSSFRELSWYPGTLLATNSDGSKIAFTAEANNFVNIFIRDAIGGKATVQRTFNRDILDMSYSPDDKFIAFTEQRKEINDDNIFMISASEGVAIQQLVSTNVPERSPTFSSDGADVFFVREEGTKYFIWSVNTKTSLTTQYGEGFTPNLYDKNSKILVTRNSKDGLRGEIWSIDLVSGTETLILNHPKKGYSTPKISPDEKRILCVGSTERDKTKPSNLDLYLVNLDGTQLTQLTFHGGHDVSPVWHPNGRSIFFISQRGNKKGKFNVWRMELNNALLLK